MRTARRRYTVGLAAVLGGLPGFAGAGALDQFTDPVDGRFDASEYLA